MGSSSYSSKRKALITGGSSGIGKSLVNKFSKENIVTGFADIIDPGLKINDTFFYKADITNPIEVESLRENFIDQIGIPDIIISNAGRGIHEMLKDGDPDKWEEVFKVNVFGALRIIRAFLPFMREQGGGDIVFISSVSAAHPYQGGAVYAATKASLDIIAETLRLEMQPEIRVITVSPGVVDTNFFRNIINGTQTPESIGWGALQPHDIADAIFYAISQPHNVALNNIVIRPIAQPM